MPGTDPGDLAKRQTTLVARQVVIDYTNHRGERAPRRILPLRIVWESSQWHPAEQWILVAVDIEKGVERSFAMKDIHSWTAA